MKTVDNYIERLKKECVWLSIANVVALVTIVLFVTTGFLQYSDTDKFFVLFPSADTKILSFSIVSMLTDVELIKNMSVLFVIMIWISAIYFGVACIVVVYDTVKRIMAVRNPRLYALKEYDKIIIGQNERKGFFKRFAVGYMLVQGISGVAVAFIMELIFNQYGLVNTSAVVVNSINTNILLPVLALIVFYIISMIPKRIKNSVKEDILKEKYLNAQTQSTQQDNTEYTQGK